MWFAHHVHSKSSIREVRNVLPLISLVVPTTNSTFTENKPVLGKSDTYSYYESPSCRLSHYTHNLPVATGIEERIFQQRYILR